jgi:hypothetical protein
VQAELEKAPHNIKQEQTMYTKAIEVQAAFRDESIRDKKFGTQSSKATARCSALPERLGIHGQARQGTQWQAQRGRRDAEEDPATSQGLEAGREPARGANLRYRPWVDQEVTGDPGYKEFNMVDARWLAQRRFTLLRHMTTKQGQGVPHYRLPAGRRQKSFGAQAQLASDRHRRRHPGSSAGRLHARKGLAVCAAFPDLSRWM